MSSPVFYGDVLYVIQFRRDPKYKFADYGMSSPDREEALAMLAERRASVRPTGATIPTAREYRLVCRATTIVEVPVS